MHRALPVLAAILFLLQPAFADKGNGSDGERYRQEDLFDARRQGDILPLGTILDILRDQGIIDILEVESEYENGRLVYEIYFLDSEGRRGEVHVDTATGRITDSEDDD